jgi:hypothetical protein
MTLKTFAIGALLLLVSTPSALAQSVKLEFADGRVTLVAQNVPVRAILAEWARLGGTRIVNGERVAAPVSIELTAVPERQALDIVLRGVAGYMMTARTAGTGASQIDRIMILPTSTPPRAAGATPVFGARPTAAQEPQDDDADDDDPAAPARRVFTRTPPVPPVIADDPSIPNPAAVTIQNGVPQTFVPGQTPSAAGARPGAPPAPRPGTPFTTLPGSSRPGEISAPPPQENRGPQGTPAPQER